MSTFDACDTCGAPLAPTIVPTPSGKRTHAVGLQCTAVSTHGPDQP